MIQDNISHRPAVHFQDLSELGEIQVDYNTKTE